MKFTKCFTLVLFSLLLLTSVHSEILMWKANVGQQYEIKTTLKESVIGLDSISEKPVEITVDVHYQEDAAKNQSTIENLRRMPSFPRASIENGSSWKADTTILYDLSAFGHKDPVEVVIPVSYTLVGMTQIGSRSYHHIKAKWFPLKVLEKSIAKRTDIKRLSGASEIDIYWDNKAGSPKKSVFIDETQYLFSNNASLLFRRELTEDFKTTTDIVRERIIRQLTDEIRTQRVTDVEVSQTDEGVVLSIENIQFEPDSAVLVSSEKTKITSIGKILSELGGSQLSIVGHAANIAGSSEQELRELSTARAKSVATFLVESGFRTANSVISKGMGGTQPLASNETAEGRRKNRRVEIIILDEESTQ